MKHNTPILAAVRSMHRDDDNHPGTNPYNTARRKGDVEAANEAARREAAAVLDCYETTLELDDAR